MNLAVFSIFKNSLKFLGRFLRQSYFEEDIKGALSTKKKHILVCGVL